MKKLALRLQAHRVHRTEPDALPLVGRAPKSGIVPALVVVLILIAMLAYLLLTAISRV